MSVDRTKTGRHEQLHMFSPLTFRLKSQENVPAPKEAEKNLIVASDNIFSGVEPPPDEENSHELQNLNLDDDLFDDEDVMQSNAQRRKRRRLAKRASGGGDRPLRMTISGRIGKIRPSQPRTAEHRHRIAPLGSISSRTRRLLPSRQFLRRKTPTTASISVSPEDIWDAMVAIPGFCFSPSDWTHSGLGSRLGLLLADPNIVRKCGRSLKRRRLPNFLLAMLAFPIRAHHGRGVFERDCGYTPGDEHDLAFWQRFAGAFGLWLGLEPESVASPPDEVFQDEELGPFLGGPVLRDLTIFLSSSRARFLDLKREPGWQQEQLEQLQKLVRRPDGQMRVSRARRRRTIVGEEADEDDDNDEDGNADDADMRGSDPVWPQKQADQPTQPTQLQRRVSVATDAWMLFLEKSREVDFDLEMLAAMCI